MSATFLRTCLAAALLAALTGCGPGVGGSGTGEVQPALGAFGASSQPLCGSEFAARLACSAGPSGAVDTQIGTAAVVFEGTAAGQVLRARFEGNQIEFTAGCVALRFRGEWGQSGSQAARFYGYTGPDGALAPATLEVRVLAQALEVTVRDAAGNLLFGPAGVAVSSGSGRCPE